MNDRLIRLGDVMELTGLSRSTIYARIKAGDKFPRPIKYRKIALWSENSIHQWIKDLKIAAGYAD